MVLVQQMIILFILMGVGFFCGKKGFIDDSFAKNLSWLVVNVATPSMILAAGMNEESTIRGMQLLFGFLLTFGVYAFLFLVSLVLVPLMGVTKADRGVYRVMTIFTNIGFMGLPIIQAAYGDEALLYGALFQFPYNLFMYTYGVAVLSGERKVSQGRKWTGFLNVGIISCAISLAIYIAAIPMPAFVVSSAKSLGSLAAPLSMIVIGQSMTHISLRDMFGDFRLLIFSMVKLTAVPVLGVLILGLFIGEEMLIRVCFIMMAVPIGSMCAMLSRQCGGNYTLASKGVALSTLLSVVTIPLLSLVLFH